MKQKSGGREFIRVTLTIKEHEHMFTSFTNEFWSGVLPLSFTPTLNLQNNDTLPAVLPSLISHYQNPARDHWLGLKTMQLNKAPKPITKWHCHIALKHHTLTGMLCNMTTYKRVPAQCFMSYSDQTFFVTAQQPNAPLKAHSRQLYGHSGRNSRRTLRNSQTDNTWLCTLLRYTWAQQWPTYSRTST